MTHNTGVMHSFPEFSRFGYDRDHTRAVRERLPVDDHFVTISACPP